MCLMLGGGFCQGNGLLQLVDNYKWFYHMPPFLSLMEPLFVLYRESQLPEHVEDLEPFPFSSHNTYRTTSEKTTNDNLDHDFSNLVKPLASQEVYQIKRTNTRPTILKKQLV